MKYILICILLCVLFLVKSIFFSIFSSIIFAVSINPWVRFLVSKGVNRLFASFFCVLLLFYGFLLVLLVLVPFIDKEILPIINNVDNLEYVKRIKSFFINIFSSKYSNILSSEYFNRIMNNLEQSGVNSLSSWIINLAFSTFSGFKNTFSSVLSFFVSVPLMTFFFVKDSELIVSFCRSLVPRRNIAKFDILFSSMHSELYEYIKRQFCLTSCMVLYYSILCLFVGMSPLIGVLMGIVSIIPYLGFIINFFLIFIMSFAYTLPLTSIILLFSFFFIAVLVENLFLIQRLFFHRMHSLYIFLFIMVFQEMVSLSSLLIAMPMCVVLSILFRSILIFYHQTDEFRL